MTTTDIGPVPVALRRVGTLRVAPAYVGLVAAVRAAMCLWADAATQTLVVHANSTNVTNLLHGRVYTLLTSAVVLQARGCLPVVPVLGIVLGIGELTWGRVRTVAVFVFGHVTASLLVFTALATGISLHQLCRHLAGAADVGVSYGVVAVVGALLVTRALPHPARWQLAAVGVALTVAMVNRTFTDAGHLTSLLLGLAVGHTRRRSVDRLRGV